MKPIVAETFPVQIELEEGKKYAWCTCGKSTKQPFCDGTHKGSEFTPLVFEAEKTEKKWLCQCKHTKNAPFCDGEHSNI